MNEPSADAKQEITDRLKALGCPQPFRQDTLRTWVRDGLARGLLEHTAVTEEVARGRDLAEVAHWCGISLWRVLHHLARQPGEQTSQTNRWRLASVAEEETL